MNLNLAPGQKATAKVTYLNASGEPATTPPTGRTFSWSVPPCTILGAVSGETDEADIVYAFDGSGTVVVSDGTLSASFDVTCATAAPIVPEAPVSDAVSLGITLSDPVPV